MSLVEGSFTDSPSQVAEMISSHIITIKLAEVQDPSPAPVLSTRHDTFRTRLEYTLVAKFRSLLRAHQLLCFSLPCQHAKLESKHHAVFFLCITNRETAALIRKFLEP